jgi:hypothetical protein
MNLESSPINWFGFLFSWHHGRLAEQVGGEVARECRAEFWQCVGPRVTDMGIARIRGYVRALAEGFVISEVDDVLERRRLNPAIRARAVASAVEQLISLAVRDALSEVPAVGARPMAA